MAWPFPRGASGAVDDERRHHELVSYHACPWRDEYIYLISLRNWPPAIMPHPGGPIAQMEGVTELKLKTFLGKPAYEVHGVSETGIV